MNKKAFVIDEGMGLPVVTSIVVVGIVLVIGFLIIEDAKNKAEIKYDIDCPKDTLCDPIMIPNWLPTILVVIISTIIMGCIMWYLQTKKKPTTLN